MAPEETATQILLRGLVDDAGLFPPASLSILQAVERHRSDRIVAHPMLTHRLLCPEQRWSELLARVNGGGPIDAAVVLDAERGFAATPPESSPGVRVTHYEARARAEDLRMAADLFRSGDLEGSGRTVFFEFDPLPEFPDLAGAPAFGRTSGWPAAVAMLGGARPLGVKIRCGGPKAAMFPGVSDLADALLACVEHDVPFTAAGLQHAVRHTDPRTGFAHHGYLNLLLATVAALSADRGAVKAALACTDGARLAAGAAEVAPGDARRARDLFTRFGARSTGDPVRDAEGLGLLGSWEI
ncbi:hypothetical protein ACFOVU_05470 [Nocardiopsis sediminis]|uniref:Uncharacterized protein n=1 Tax=Nocardiopsis sediminis TaxID=1778267 RepID=A0ABV8FGR9_9ACTN